MSKKIVIEEKGANVIVGIQETGQDPYIISSVGTVDSVLPVVPALMAQAALVRAAAPRQPYAKAATPATPAPKPKARKPEKKEEPAEPAMSEEGKKQLEMMAEASKTEPAAAAVAQGEPEAETGEEEEVTPVQMPESPTDKGEIAIETPAEVKQASVDLPKLETPEEPKNEAEKSMDPGAETKRRKKSSSEQFFIKATGAGPFGDIQAVFDAMGMDKEKRPHHNRYDRLSSDLKEKIEQRSSSNV